MLLSRFIAYLTLDKYLLHPNLYAFTIRHQVDGYIT